MVDSSPSPSPSPAESSSSTAATSSSGSGEGKPPAVAGGDRIQRQSPKNNNKKRSNGSSKSSKKRKEGEEEDGQWKVCKGYLYFSSRLKSHGRAPSCFGTQKPLPRVPASMSKNYKVVSAREGNLSYFKYACVGYSLFSRAEDSSTKEKNEPASLPVCAGYELLLGKKTSTTSKVPYLTSRANRKQYKEDLYFLRSRTTSKVLARENFVGRFTRSAELVAAGVARNLLKVGSYIKDNLGNMLYPDRRRRK